MLAATKPQTYKSWKSNLRLEIIAISSLPVVDGARRRIVKYATPVLRWQKKRGHLTLVLATLLFASCANDVRDRDQLDAFAAAYVDFHKALYDSEVSMWATGLDVSGQESLSPYRQAFVSAFDVRATNRVRVLNARQAVIAQRSDGLLDDFGNHIDVCDAKSLALVEAANHIEKEDFRRQAISLAATARSTLGKLTKLKDEYGEIYSLQVKLANELALSDGDLHGIRPLMAQMVPKQNKLFDETNELREQEQDSVRLMEGEYAALKGTSGITLDYRPPK